MQTRFFLLLFGLGSAFAQGQLSVPVVFVSRPTPGHGTVYWEVPKSLPGVGPYARFQVAAPAKLLVREANGTIRTLLDGAAPTASTLNLVDFNAPDVSWDGTRIVFAGLPAGEYTDEPLVDPGAWRLFLIQADGTGLRQLTLSDRTLDLSQFGELANSFAAYDDADPCWLPDGRVVFSSTRYPSKGMYGAVRTTQLHVINVDGTGLHRITSERNGADRPVIDPLTGQIVFSRWWRNFRLPTDSLASYPAPAPEEFFQHEGLVSAFDVGNAPYAEGSGGRDNLKRNAWHLGVINPDGTSLRMFAGESQLFALGEEASHAYGGAFAADGQFYANYFPMQNMTEAAGFGGIRRYQRGAAKYVAIIGVTKNLVPYYYNADPTSYGVYAPPYAAEPVVLPDGRLLISWAAGVEQDYGLYTINADGSGRTLVYDAGGKTDARAALLAPRPVPPIIANRVTQAAPALPPTGVDYTAGGTFSFDARNVYFNAPVDAAMVSAPAVGSAAVIRFFIDHQRQQPGSHERRDWPVLLNEVPVAADGSIPPTASPADVPLFEQVRTPSNTVALTNPGQPGLGGATHAGGHNYGRPGDRVSCVGCHAGHSMIPLPPTAEAALWSNLAPGATARASSARDFHDPRMLIDRRQFNNEDWQAWVTRPGDSINQWAGLDFAAPIIVRAVRLWGARPRADAGSLLVHQATAILFKDADATVEAARATISQTILATGAEVAFADVPARSLRVQFDSVSGTYFSLPSVSLGEIEVIAKGGVPTPIENWRRQHFGTVSNLGQADDRHDADGDEQQNLIEYALVSDPRLPSPEESLTVSHVEEAGQSFLTVGVKRDPSRSDIVTMVETSGDLKQWTPIATSTGGAVYSGLATVAETPEGALRAVRLRQPIESFPLFVRARVRGL